MNKLERILNSRPVTPDRVIEIIDQEMGPLVDAFAKRLEREEGLRDDVIVDPPCPSPID